MPGLSKPQLPTGTGTATSVLWGKENHAQPSVNQEEREHFSPTASDRSYLPSCFTPPFMLPLQNYLSQMQQYSKVSKFPKLTRMLIRWDYRMAGQGNLGKELQVEWQPSYQDGEQGRRLRGLQPVEAKQLKTSIVCHASLGCYLGQVQEVTCMRCQHQLLEEYITARGHQSKEYKVLAEAQARKARPGTSSLNVSCVHVFPPSELTQYLRGRNWRRMRLNENGDLSQTKKSISSMGYFNIHRNPHILSSEFETNIKEVINKINQLHFPLPIHVLCHRIW